MDWDSLSDTSNSHKQYFPYNVKHISFLVRWSGEFGHVANYNFMLDATRRAMQILDFQWMMLRRWLNCYPRILDNFVSS